MDRHRQLLIPQVQLADLADVLHYEAVLVALGEVNTSATWLTLTDLTTITITRY